MHVTKQQWFGGLAAVGLTLSGALGCGTAGSSAPTAPVPARFQGPLATSADPERGRRLYEKYCNGCHPGGQADLGPALAGKDMEPGRIRWLVREGGETMPAFPARKISDEDLEHLAAFVIRSL